MSETNSRLVFESIPQPNCASNCVIQEIVIKAPEVQQTIDPTVQTITEDIGDLNIVHRCAPPLKKKTYKVKGRRGKGRPKKKLVIDSKKLRLEKIRQIKAKKQGIKALNNKMSAKTSVPNNTSLQSPIKLTQSALNYSISGEAVDSSGCHQLSNDMTTDKRFNHLNETPVKTSVKKSTPLKTNDKQFECPDCHRIYHNKQSFKGHLKQNHNKSLLECHLCDYMTIKNKDYIHHKSLHSVFICHFQGCDQTFTLRSQLNEHLMTHPEGRPYKCSVKGCEKRFKSKRDVAFHIATHSTARPFKCPISGCDKRFKTQKTLSDHMRNPNLHKTNGASDYSDFEHSFTSAESVEQEVSSEESSEFEESSESEEELFVCKWNGCTFHTDDQRALSTHTRHTHINHRPFKCYETDCKHSYISELQLERHLRDSHSLTRYKSGKEFHKVFY